MIHSSGLTSTQIDALYRRATEAAANAYAPYSRFRVGAALLLTTGETVTGCNVENASYRLTTCAEQAAIARAVIQHGPAIKLRAVAVANLNHAVSQPCGACRQTLVEFALPTTWVFYPADDNTVAENPLSAILPAAFLLDPTS